jgi:tetratricopeptide (TPR) repeat protein
LGTRLLKILLVSLIAICIAFFTVDRQVDGWKKEAERFLAAGQAPTADLMYQKITHIEPWRALDWRTLAYMYAGQGNSERTISILEPWIRNNRLADEDIVILAQAYRDTGSGSKAKELLVSAAQQADSTEEGGQKILLTLEAFYRADQEYEQAFQCLETLNSRGLNTPESDLEMDLISGVTHPERLSGLAERQSPPPVWLEQWAVAISAATHETDAAHRWLQIGRAYGNIGEWDLAEYAFTQSTKIPPDLADAWALLAEARQQQGKNGVDAINRALDLAPDSLTVRLTAALYYRRQHDTKKAVELLKENISDNPKELIWYLELGNALAEGGKLDDAVLAFQQAVDLAPRNPDGYRAAARFSIQYAYQLEEVGLKAAESVIQLEGDSAEGYDLKGQVLLALEKPEDAAAAFNMAVERDETYAPVWLHIGQMAIDTIDYSRAKIALEKAMALGGRAYEGQVASRLLKEYFGG